ncbi:MAG: N-acetylmuramoyl-L-alanine amidase [Candidatus Wallbacteria bacterium]
MKIIKKNNYSLSVIIYMSIAGILLLLFMTMNVNNNCYAADSTVLIEDNEIEVTNVGGQNYISLKKLASKIKLSVKYSDASKIYSFKDRSSGREFKFAVDKRVIISGTNFYKSKSPIIKVDDDVKLPLEMVSEIYKVKKADTEDEETDEPEDNPKDIKDKKEEPAAAAKISATTEAELKKEKSVSEFVLENIKYKRGKNTFELDIAFNKKPENSNFKVIQSGDKKSIEIIVMTPDSKISEQTVKISDSIINSIKLNEADKIQKTRKIMVLSANDTFEVAHSVQDNILKINFNAKFIENRISEISAPSETASVTIKTASNGSADNNTVEISILPAKKTAEVTLTPSNIIAGGVPKKENINYEIELKKELENLKLIIAIDPGHGGEDFGVVSPNNLKEKDLTLDLARRLKELFDKTPIKSVLIRMGDYYMPYENRVSVANSYGAGLLISLHAGTSQSTQAAGVGVFYNGSGNSAAPGYLISMGTSEMVLNKSVLRSKVENDVEAILKTIDSFKKTEESQKIADCINEAMRKNAKIKVRKFRETSLSLLSETVIPGIVIETGFLSNADDEKLLLSTDYKDELAKIIFEGIKKYIYSSKLFKQ